MKKILPLLLLMCCCNLIQAQFCFADALPFNFGNAPRCIVTGDFDADGKIDLLTYNEGPSTLTVARGNGLGNFATPTAATTTSNVCAISAMVAADVNNDSKLDVVIRCGGGGGLLLGNNTGTFTLAPNNGTPFPTLSGNGLAVGYFDNDLYLDAAVSNFSRIVIAYGNASGFRTNNLEIIVPPGLSGSNNMSRGTLVAKDFNNDGLVDFAVNNADDSSLSVLVNDGNGTYFATNYLFPANSNFDRPLKAGDFNGDGNIDLLSVSASNLSSNSAVIKVFLGDGLGGFANSVSTPTINQNYSDYQIADFDGDGILDILSNNQDAVKISKGTGTGSFEAPDVFYTSQYADAYFIVNNFVSDDFNTDGRPDIATANFNNTTDGHKVSVLLNTRVEILTTVPATRCGSGSVTLSATADSGTIEWYDSPTDINNIATGPSFTTPVLTGTTTYYVGTNNNTCRSERIPVEATIISNVNPTALAANSVTTSAATLNWTVQSAPASGFDYYYSTTNATPTALTTPSGSTIQTTISLNTLSAATPYYFWVRSNCGASSGNWVGTTFTTLSNSGCSNPSGLSSGSITSSGAILTWVAASPAPASGYQYYYSTSSTTPTVSTTPSGITATTSVAITGLTTGAVYYYWIRSNCGASQSGWVAGSSFTATPATGCTAAIYGQFPANTFTPSCTGSIETIVTNAYAGEYALVNIIANKQYTFSSSVTTDYVTITNANATVVYSAGNMPLVWASGSITGVIRYYFHTDAACGTQDVDRTRFITCEGAVAVCNAPSVLNVTGITAGGATLNWTAANPSPSNGYQYYYSTSNSTPTASTTPSGNAASTTATLTGLNASTVYYYWVRSNCGANQGSWVAGTSFTTSAVVAAGCTTATFGLWPTSTFSPSCTGTDQLIVDNAYAGEYSYVNITANTLYTFSSSVTTDYITIANSTGTSVLAHGPSPLVWPSGVNAGELRYYFHTNASCGEQNTNRSRFIQCSGVLVSETFSFNGLKLFPSPTKHLLNISNDHDIDSVALFNMLGQLVKEQTIHAKAGTVDMSAFARGTYFVKVISAYGSKILKIIKE